MYNSIGNCFTNAIQMRSGINRAITTNNCNNRSQIQEGILAGVLQLLYTEYGVNPLGRSRDCPIESCGSVQQPGMYWIRNGTEIIQQYCF